MIQIRLYCSILALIILTSCGTQQSDNSSDSNSNIEYVTLNETKNINSNGTIELKINAIKFKDESESFINKNIQTDLSNYFSFENYKFDNNSLNQSTLNNLISKYLNNMRNDYSDLDQDSFELFSSINIDTSYTINNLIVLRMMTESYLGGAHGAYSTEYKVFDTKKKLQLKAEDIFNLENLTRISYDYFLTERGISKKEVNVKDEGFWFKDDKFHLNNNFKIDEKNITFIFNPYEIASYADGQIEIVVPLSKLDDVVKEEYKYIIK